MSVKDRIEDLEIHLEEAEEELELLLERGDADADDLDWAEEHVEELRQQLAELRAESV